jgi:uncharacterized protein
LNLYFDTSILIAAYCPETLSLKAESLLAKTSKRYVSPLTETELASAMARKVRDHDIAVIDARKILIQYRNQVREGIYSMISCTADHFTVAAELLSGFQTSLRTLDALHTAIAYSSSLTMATADKGLFDSCKIIGIHVILLS